MNINPRLLASIQEVLGAHGCDAWIIYSMGNRNPILAEMVRDELVCTRPVFFVIERSGQSTIICSGLEAEPLGNCADRTCSYRSRDELCRLLQASIGGCTRAMMEFSPRLEDPAVSLADAGAVDLVRSMGVSVVSSAPMLQALFARWGDGGYASHKRAASDLCQIMLGGFSFLRDHWKDGVTEMDVRDAMVHRMLAGRYVFEYAPLVAFGNNSSHVHHVSSGERSAVARYGDVILIDAHLREDSPEAIYADITLMGQLADRVAPDVSSLFDVVVAARNEGSDFIVNKLHAGIAIAGCDVDRHVRSFVERKGYGAHFLHRTGHSLDHRGHGFGVNLDSFETVDRRQITDDIGFSLEPGIYLEQYGVRSEINCYVMSGDMEITTVRQRALMAILSDSYDVFFETT